MDDRVTRRGVARRGAELALDTRIAGEPGREPTVTIARRAYQEGWDLGWEEGRQEVRQEILLELVGRRFGAPSAELVARVTAAADDDVDGWLCSIVDAESLDELLG